MVDFNSLINSCSPAIDQRVAKAIIQKESGFLPFVIGVNKTKINFKQPRNYSEAVYRAKDLIAKGYNIDLGLAQINSGNLAWLNLSVEDVLDPCKNLNAMQKVYLSCYQNTGDFDIGRKMQRAFSCYNTGNYKSGFFNGYVNAVTKNFNNNLLPITKEKNSDINRKSLSNENLTDYVAIPKKQGEEVSEGTSNTNQETDLESKTKSEAWDIFSEF